MTRQNRTRRNWWVIVAVVLVVLLAVAGLLRFFLSSGEAGEGATSQTPSITSNSESSPSPDPRPTSTEGLEEIENNVPLINNYDCQNFMNAKEYTSFMNRLYKFEVISQMQPSDKRLELMYPYVTEAFMTTQVGFYETEVDESIEIQVSQESAIGCSTDSQGTILARITPVVTVVRISDDNTSTVLQGPLTLPATHFTRWVELENTWYVTEEK